MILPITLTIAGAAAIVNTWLAIRIATIRFKAKILIGDGGHPLLATRMRSQLNFAEYTPIVLILIAVIEMARGTQTWLWVVGIIYILGRVLHPFGMDRQTANPLRAVALLTSLGTMLVLAAYAISIPYVTKDGTITTVASDGLHVGN